MLPSRLKKQDRIGVIAPSDPIEQKDLEDINKSILLMEASGFEVTFGKYAFSNSTGYGATAKEKAEDINSMFANPKIKMIFCAKGGQNCNTTLEYLDYELIKKNPKILCGFSDSTALLNKIYEETGLITFHGSTFKSLVTWETEYSYEQIIKRLVEGDPKLAQANDYFQTIVEGTAQGKLVGGNLTTFVKTIESGINPIWKDAILFLEELGLEADPACVSSNLAILKQKGIWDTIQGVWIGNYEHPSNKQIEVAHVVNTISQKIIFSVKYAQAIKAQIKE